MNLIEHWRTHLWKAWSVRLAYLMALPGVLWPLIPQDMRDALPPGYVSAFAVVAAISIALARIVGQPNMIVDKKGTNDES